MTGTTPIMYWAPVTCLDCGAAIFVGMGHPRPPRPIKRTYCGDCGSHRLVDREPTIDDEDDYRALRPLSLEWVIRERKRFRNSRREGHLYPPAVAKMLGRIAGRT